MNKNFLSNTNLFFSTFTNLWWKNVLAEDHRKKIILDSLDFLILNSRVVLYGYVIMPNHIHLLWEICEGHELPNVQRDFLKFTAQQIKFDLKNTDDPFLKELWVNAYDRKYQFWERNGLSVKLFKSSTILQKLEYIHCNPLQPKWKLVPRPQDYRFSSAAFYAGGKDEFEIVTHINERIATSGLSIM